MDQMHPTKTALRRRHNQLSLLAEPSPSSAAHLSYDRRRRGIPGRAVWTPGENGLRR